MNIQELVSHTNFFLALDVSSISKDILETYMRDLWQLITQHNTLYYTAQPIISDKEYDDLFQLLLSREDLYPDLTSANSPTQKMNIDIQTGFVKKEHGEHRLLSLKNSYIAWDLCDRDAFIKRQLPEWQEYTFLVEPKFDGSSIQLIYEYGQYVAAITRWDGRTWEDVTQHIRLVHNLPLYIEEMKDIQEVRLRAEVMMTKTAFAHVNKEQIKKWLPPFANERNAASGTLRQLDPNIVKKRGLVLYILDLVYWSYPQKLAFDSQRKELLAAWWLPCFSRSKTCSDIQEVISICLDDAVKKELYNNDLLFDGLVIKIDAISLRDELGATDHHPRRAMAYKYPAEQTTTMLKDIMYQLWRTGVVTPVAELEPVELSWAVISRATLHNFDMIKKLDIRIGDAVWIQRSGEVIPYIIGPVIQRRTWSEKKVEVPEKCPSCWMVLSRKEWEVAWICTNKEWCKWQQIEQLKHSVSKHCMNISWLGDALVTQLVDVWLVANWSEIFSLPEHKNIRVLRSMPGIAEKKIQQLTQDIDIAKNMELWRWLHALWIPFVWKKVSRILELHVDTYWPDSVDKTVLRKAFLNKEDLDKLYWIGEQTIDALYDFFSDTCVYEQLAFASTYGFSLYIKKKNLDKDAVLLWERIVLTWSFPLSRQLLSDFFSSLGARMSSSVSGSTTRVVYGDNPWSKLQKAYSLEVRATSLDEFLDEYMLDLPDLKWKNPPPTHTAVSLF